MLRTLLWKNAFNDPVIFQPPNHKFLGYLRRIPYANFEHFEEIFRFWVKLRANRQTNKQTAQTFYPRRPTFNDNNADIVHSTV